MSPILLLAGTAEARILAARLADLPGIRPIASLAGATEHPADYPIPVRRGGFGGTAGLIGWLAQNHTAALIDATHPFALQMQNHAARAARVCGIAHLRLLRPPWPIRPGWIEVPSIAAAAAALPAGARVLITAGRKHLGAFAERTDLHLVLRTIEPVPDLPAHIQPLLARPSRDQAAEQDVMRRLGVTHLVAKNSGGPATARLDAAEVLRLTTIMIARPPRPAGTVVETVEASVAWLGKTITIAG